MRTLITIILLVFQYAYVIIAQNISVASFKMLPNDLTANTQGTIVYDQNGEKCALIKVETTQTGFSFDAGSLGVVKNEQKVGEIWVYVPDGVKRLSIFHQQLGNIRDYDLGMSVQKAKTYLLKLTTGTVTTIVENAVTSQFLVIRTEPSNATVLVNDEVWNVLDGIARKWVPFGTYTYKVMSPDYFPEVGHVTVNSPTEKTELNIALKPNFTTITLQSEEGVEIWFMGEKKGIGSWCGTIGECDLTVETRKAGYRSATTMCHIVPKDGPQTIKLNEPTPKYGSLMVSTLPNDAVIYVDEDSVGLTPMLIPRVLEGSHLIRVSKNGYADLSKTAIINEAQQTMVEGSQESGWYTNESGEKYKGDWKDGMWHGKGSWINKEGETYTGDFVNGKREGKGVSTWPIGDTYEGEFVAGYRSGKGYYKWADGGTYDGEWKSGRFNGYGVRKYANGDSYEGYWDDGEYNGQGALVDSDGTTYIGSFVKGKFEGIGTWKSNDGDMYVGSFKNYKFEGQGQLTLSNGSVYVGSFVNGNMEGQGNWTSKDGDTYVGTFVNYEFEGQGTFTTKDGDKYVGSFVNSEKDGKGIYTWADGGYYEGDFKENKYHGYGIRKYANGGSYEGDWQNDKYHGRGTWISKNGDTYAGLFANGEKEGHGIYTWASGSSYEGEWKNDKRHGPGVHIDKDGKKEKQTWLNGVLQK